MKKLLKKLNSYIYSNCPFYIYSKYVDIKVNTEHFIECPAQRWNLNKTRTLLEPCCDKDWNLHWKHDFERGR